MMTIREYARPATLEEAWQLNQKKPNRVLGGMLWLKMEKINVGTAIDLSALGLDTIEETDTEIIIGAMATLRDLETNAALNAYTAGAVREAVRHIVGVPSKRLLSFTLEPASLARLSVVCETFAAAQLDRRFKTLDFYKSIKLT